MKKKGYYEYDPVIYPRRLCVAIGMNQEDANKCFEGRNGEVLMVDFTNYDAVTYDCVRDKANKKICSFINFESKGSMKMGLCCHEASAYLMGWIASCINKARLGIGNFIEIKDIKE
jgi:hypothetical protein